MTLWFPKDMKGNNFYIWIGTFSLLLMFWLWVGPKLIKKPAGTPPRAGSNEEAKELGRAVSGMPPAPMSGKGITPMGTSSRMPSGLTIPRLNEGTGGPVPMGPVRFAKAALSDMYPISHLSV